MHPNREVLLRFIVLACPKVKQDMRLEPSHFSRTYNVSLGRRILSPFVHTNVPLDVTDKSSEMEYHPWKRMHLGSSLAPVSRKRPNIRAVKMVNARMNIAYRTRALATITLQPPFIACVLALKSSENQQYQCGASSDLAKPFASFRKMRWNQCRYQPASHVSRTAPS